MYKNDRKGDFFMQLPHADDLEIQYLNRLFDNKSECYKLFWFQAIVTKIVEGHDSFTYEELVNEMIVDAWYMVSEYHLNLGPKDNLEAVVLRLCEITNFKSSEKKEVLLNYLKECTDKKVIDLKKVLTLNVPYRLQAPFMENIKGKAWNIGKHKLILFGEAVMQKGLQEAGWDFISVKNLCIKWMGRYFQESKEKSCV